MTKELTIIKDSSVPVLSTPGASKAVMDTLEGMGAGTFDLPKLVVPSGASGKWIVDGPDGSKAVDSFNAVVLRSLGKQRAFYLSQNPTGQAPDCTSVDGITGFGVRSRDDVSASAQECASCSWNQRGSGSTVAGRRCSEAIFLWLALEDNITPHFLKVPSGSLKSFGRYGLKLLGDGGLDRVVTTFGLEKATADTNDGEVDFCRIKASKARRLTDAEYEALAPMREFMDSMQVGDFYYAED